MLRTPPDRPIADCSGKHLIVNTNRRKLMRHILLDLKTGETFSFLRGWSKEEASIRPSEAWCQYIYYAKGALNDQSWKDRMIVAVPLPHEQEEYT